MEITNIKEKETDMSVVSEQIDQLNQEEVPEP